MTIHTKNNSLSFLLEKAKLQSDGINDVQVEGLSYDSRLVSKGDLFFAIKGAQSDGHDFLGKVVEKGASAAIVEKSVSLPIPSIQTSNIYESMSIIANQFYGEPSRSLPVIGITGTNGKTTVTYLLEKIFEHANKKVGVIGTVNYRFNGTVSPAPNTTPMSIDVHKFIRLIKDNNGDALIMEVSSHALELGRVSDVSYQIAVFTNLTQDHLDFHKDMESYFKAKAKLFRENTSAKQILNIDDPYGVRLSKDFPEAMTYGFADDAKLKAMNPVFSLSGVTFEMKMPTGKIFKINSNIMGRYNILNILAASATAVASGISEECVVGALSQAQSIPGRLERVQNKKNFAVLVDYAHTPDALEKVLTTLKEVKHNKLICVFGAGGDRDKKKRPLMGGIAGDLADEIFLTSDNPRTEDPVQILKDVEKGLENKNTKYTVIEDRKKAIIQAIHAAVPEDIVLIAGKGHEDYQIYGTEKKHFSDQETALKALA